jgi:hypothetical protein
MTIPGRVHNGVVILEGGTQLPEGASVAVSFPVAAKSAPARERRRIQFPLVRTGKPGSLTLTGEQIAKILDDEDAVSRH